MNCVRFSVFIVAGFLIFLARSQDICDPSQIVPVTPSVDFPVYDFNARYHATVERNDNFAHITQDFQEYYDGMANIHVTSGFLLEEQIIYSYNQTQELIVYDPCKTFETLYK